MTSYYLNTVTPEKATDQLKAIYDGLLTMFPMVPKIFIAQSIRPDLLEPMTMYIKRLLFDTHALSRATKELIAAYVSKLNACAYCVDAHSAMAMAQGFTRDQVKSIIEDVQGSSLIDEKTKILLQLAEKITKTPHQIHVGTIAQLKEHGVSDEELFEAIAVASLFNYMDRMADGLGAPVEGFQDMMAQMNG